MRQDTEARALYYRANRWWIREQQAAYYAENRDQIRARRAVQRAARLSRHLVPDQHPPTTDDL